MKTAASALLLALHTYIVVVLAEEECKLGDVIRAVQRRCVVEGKHTALICRVAKQDRDMLKLARLEQPHYLAKAQ